jgi:hypothetical protein
VAIRFVSQNISPEPMIMEEKAKKSNHRSGEIQ